MRLTLDLAVSMGRLPTKMVRRSRSPDVSPEGTYFVFGPLILSLPFLNPGFILSCTRSLSPSSSSPDPSASSNATPADVDATGAEGAETGSSVSSSAVRSRSLDLDFLVDLSFLAFLDGPGTGASGCASATTTGAGAGNVGTSLANEA